MFKKAFVRGITQGLVASGYAAFPDEDTQAKVADYIADHVDIPLFEEKTGSVIEPPFSVKVAVANHILDAAQDLQARGFRPSEPVKIASVEDLAKLAHVNTIHLMRLAEGSTMEGGDKGNAEANSAEGKMDERQRPVGYAENSRGTSDVDTRPGAVGKEQEHPNAPAQTDHKPNSVQEASKSAAELGRLIKKLGGMGSTLTGGDKGNHEPTTAEGKMDLAARPMGYAQLPSQGAAGAIPALATGAAIMGREMSHPNGPANSPSGTNSVTQHSAKAASVEEQAHLVLFKKVAAETVPHMPPGLSDQERIAHINTMLGFNPEQKARYLVDLQRSKTASAQPASTGSLPTGHPYGTEHNPQVSHSTARYDGRNANQKQAGDIAQMVAEMKKDDEKHEEKGEKHEEKKDDADDKKDEKNANANFLARIRALGGV